MFAKPQILLDTNTLSSHVSDYELLSYYFGITRMGVTNSPLRPDRHPSFSLTSKTGKITYKDFSTGEYGDVLDMICKKFGITIKDALSMIARDFKVKPTSHTYQHKTTYVKKEQKHPNVIQVRVRGFETYDKEYWQTYGVDLEFLKQFDIYPIDYYWINANVFRADKFAYTYVEERNGEIYHKIYQPLNSDGHKWFNNYPKDTMSLIYAVDRGVSDIIICSSVKDALCLWGNLQVHCIAPQGEGYDIPFEHLKKMFPNARFRILYDNDKKGLEYSSHLSGKYNIENIVIPPFEGGKDVSDYYKLNGRTPFINMFNKLINDKNGRDNTHNEEGQRDKENQTP